MILLPMSVTLLLLNLSDGQIIDFKDGNVGVNFGGYHASAGLGGLLSGDAAKGGLHAEAGTPYGQSAGAGLGGGIEDDGTSRGGLYAGATAGKGISAGAGLGGTVSKSGTSGFAVAESADKVLETNIQPIQQPGKHSEKEVHVAVSEAKLPEQPLYISKPVPPPVNKEVYVHKTYARRPHHWRKHAYVSTVNIAPSSAETAKVVERIYSKPIPPPVEVHKYVQKPAYRGGFISRLFATPVAPEIVNKEVIATPVKTHNVDYTASATIRNGGEFIKDIFNIPISTLNAVSQLVSNIAGGTSVSVSKKYDANYHH